MLSGVYWSFGEKLKFGIWRTNFICEYCEPQTLNPVKTYGRYINIWTNMYITKKMIRLFPLHAQRLSTCITDGGGCKKSYSIIRKWQRWKICPNAPILTANLVMSSEYEKPVRSVMCGLNKSESIYLLKWEL